MIEKSVEIPITYPCEVFHNEASDYQEIFFLLHGFQQSGDFIFKRLLPHLPKKALVIAPNAPFLVPIKKDNRYHKAYAWYFFDPYTKEFPINYDPASHYLKNLGVHLGFKNVPITIIGYSQGGYLAPKVAELYPNCKKVIGLNCIFRPGRFEINLNADYTQVHGKNDDIVSINEARENYQSLFESTEMFYEVESDHRLSDEVIQKLSEVL